MSRAIDTAAESTRRSALPDHHRRFRCVHGRQRSRRLRRSESGGKIERLDEISEVPAFDCSEQQADHRSSRRRGDRNGNRSCCSTVTMFSPANDGDFLDSADTILGQPPEGASSLLMPLACGHHRAFAMLAMGRTLDAYEAQTAGFGQRRGRRRSRRDRGQKDRPRDLRAVAGSGGNYPETA